MTKEIATTILQQLGGNKFIAMTGAKNLIAKENGLSFKIGKNKASANYVTITLNGMDLYNMIFERVSISKKTYEMKRTEVAGSLNTYAEDLQKQFTFITGLYTRLF